MISYMKKMFKKRDLQLALGRWNRTHDVTKAIYANSDHCGDIICGDPKKVKTIVNNQKNVVKLQSSNKFHTSVEKNMCCMLLGLNGPCIDCNLIPKKITQKDLV